MDIRKVKKLIELLEESQLSEIEISQGEESIRLSRHPAPATPPAPAPRVESAAPPPAPPGDEGDRESGHAITSPMVGTYYAAPGPDAEPFVTPGARVAVGETLCIIEAMKIFNPIEAEKAGVVKRVFKSNGDPVEFGETLFVIE